MNAADELNREELIHKLQKVSFCAVPTVATFDMGLQYDWIGPNGAGTGLGNILSWPAYRIRTIHAQRWQEIQKKIRMKDLKIDDLKDTDLLELAKTFVAAYNIHYDCLADLFIDLADFPDHLDCDFFCLFDDVSWACQPEFYASKDELLSRFEDKYCGGEVAWEEMGIEELKEWLDRSEDDLSHFPFNILYDDPE